MTSNLSNISSIRIRKQEKLNSIYSCLTNSIGKDFSIFVPSATLNLCNTDIPFDPDNHQAIIWDLLPSSLEKIKNQ